MSHRSALMLVLPLLVFSCFFLNSVHADFYRDIDITWGEGRAMILDDGKLLTLSLDRFSGSAFQSKNEFLFGRFDAEIKLVPGNSAGTVTTFYLSSEGRNHDEIDFEFLGNLSGDPYTVHTNVFVNDKGSREQQFHLWFDPTEDFHTYSILWTPQHIIFLVDNIPIRDFKNHESEGVPFPKNRPMRLYSRLWDEEWATRGGLVKTDWDQAPFTASYRNFNFDACVWSASKGSSCTSNSPMTRQRAWYAKELDSMSYERMRSVQSNYMIYNYCSDVKRFLQGVPQECRLRDNQFDATQPSGKGYSEN